MRVREIAFAIAVMGCRSSEPPAAPQAAPKRDDPTTCSASSNWYAEQDSRVQDALMAGIAGLGECAASLEQPSAVLTQVVFRADGTAEKVLVRRANTADCRALDCVRHRLAQVKVPAVPEGKRVAGADFVLRRNPAPDGNEKVQWNEGSASTQCTNPVLPAGDLGLTREDIRGPLENRYARLQTCYESGLARDPDLRGRVVLHITIDLQGKVESLSVADNQLANCQVVACIVSELRDLAFPPPRDTFTLEHPFNFEPRKDRK
jgi:hypothetical protein